MDSTFQPKGSERAKVQNLKQPGHGSEMAKVSVLDVRWYRSWWDSKRDQVRKPCAVCES